ncbi:MAG: VOC family protein [Dehalococcoidia bacterium]|jgi:catechol 2,3-dioxygenase-like lactoylglutathione lyase family enzyme|nr:VOC family protein [Dehalococcoidia bacterium]MDW8009110.1 VOC family protein [Chloroflexota bacterium]
MAVRRLREVLIGAQEVDAALETYRANLGLQVMGCAEGEEGHVHVGETTLVILRPDIAAGRLPGIDPAEGMLAISLEVDDLDGMVARLRRAGVQVTDPAPGHEEGTRIARVAPEHAGGAPLLLVERP